MSAYDADRQNSLLTESQRKLLYSNVKSGVTTERMRIRERVREGLRDFRVLTDHLDDRDRKLIFDAEAGSSDYNHLEGDVQAAIEFLYTGMGGSAAFARPLKQGVANGEVALENTESALSVNPRFAVDVVPRGSAVLGMLAVKAMKWDRLEPPDLFDFVKLAMRADAIDFGAIENQLDKEAVREAAQKAIEEP